MTTITRQEAINSTLMDFLSQRHILKEKSELMARRFKCSLAQFEGTLTRNKEDFAAWDMFMEWKSIDAALKEIDRKIAELELGEFSLA